MLDGLLHRNNFRTKCKSAINRTKTRLEVINKKRNAVQKFLKKDIADLLKNNLDQNAYGRAEGLYVELNLTSCYDYVGKCCAGISEHLKQMHKERECPEECKVAVSSLVYAAARFSDLPQLRDLRNLFTERYPKSVDAASEEVRTYTRNKLYHLLGEPFVDKLKSTPPTVEMKIQLMQEIAQEFSITWDSLPLQRQLHAQRSEKPVASRNGASDKMLKSRSTITQVKPKQENSNKVTSVEEANKLRSRRHNSYSKFPEEKNNRKEVTIGNNREIASKKEDNNASLRYNDDLFSNGKQRLKSVRTKLRSPSPSSRTSSSDVGRPESARAPQERKREVLGKTPTSARNTRFPTTAVGEKNKDVVSPKGGLPPPPGKRRYLFVEDELNGRSNW